VEQVENFVTRETIGAPNDEDDGETRRFAQIVLDRQEADPKGLFVLLVVLFARRAAKLSGLEHGATVA